MPAWIVAAVTVLNWLDRPPFAVELLVYVALGVAWVLPFRFVFRGVGRAAEDEEQGTPPGRGSGR